MRTLTTLLIAAVALLSPAGAHADDLPPGYIEPPGPCVLDPESGLWMAPGPLPCGPTLLELASGPTLPPIDPTTGCTPVVPSDGCDQPVASVQTYDGCEGPEGYCTTEPPTTTEPPPTTTEPTTTTEPPATTAPVTTAPATTEPATTAPATTEPTTTEPPVTSEPAVSVVPPPVPTTECPPTDSQGRPLNENCEPDICLVRPGVTGGYDSSDYVRGHVPGGDWGSTFRFVQDCTVPTTTTTPPNLPVTGPPAWLQPSLTIATVTFLAGALLVAIARRRGAR